MTWLQGNFRYVGWLPLVFYVGGECFSAAILWLASFPTGIVLALAGTMTLRWAVRPGNALRAHLIALAMSLSPFVLLAVSTLIEAGIPRPD
ncbi:MAG TPA: hypothetical protein VF267_04725 [Gammaproteobacteria bacterium]